MYARLRHPYRRSVTSSRLTHCLGRRSGTSPAPQLGQGGLPKGGPGRGVYDNGSGKPAGQLGRIPERVVGAGVAEHVGHGAPADGDAAVSHLRRVAQDLSRRRITAELGIRVAPGTVAAVRRDHTDTRVDSRSGMDRRPSSMAFVWRKLANRYIWRRIMVERMSEPLHLNAAAVLVGIFGSFRSKVAFDLILRHHHAYAILNAADQAARLGIRTVNLLEFGVARGAGLLNMAHVAERVTQETGVQFKITGFDTGAGMPEPRSFRDHPELYQPGDYTMDLPALEAALPSTVSLVLGDLTDTVPPFIETLDPSCPVGFVSIDVDYYWSTKDALVVFNGDPLLYLPRSFVYLDDLEDPSHNSYCGEMLAVNEFNLEHDLRKIEKHAFLGKYRVFQKARWIDHVYTLHVFDHPSRATLLQPREQAVLTNPYTQTAFRR